ncbi:DUF4349 domain-containing protein [Nonomuraea gerenzanensis]|uniref:Putative lipoprotein n=1 Tax=Nonomuraea gerenzanensis TaxID=93944 RepID=A0A1M4EKL9_9ACTN|nr:DUF4349 domain-containing protein [Nonomuraea gerenzanensis]UBU10691.1 DUF4349 domain-containing protein [Nonomuraea gerenzanensis]SBO99113.1 putative lipoprotein [Nonomuraea gerenzanensis]
MTRFRYGIALTAICATALLTACGGGASYDSGGAPASAPSAGSQAQSAEEAQGESSRDQARPEKAEMSANAAAGVEVVQQERQVIYTSSMTVRAERVAPTVLKAKQLVTEAGGYLSKEESDSSADSEASAMLEFKIPVAKYPEVLRRLGGELGKQLSLTQNAKDVTLKVADVESRLKSAQQSLESLRALLKRADTIGQVLDVEREISTREADLESLQAQQKQLATQTSMATLTLRLVGPVVEVTDPADEPRGFFAGMEAGWRALVAFTRTALTVLGALLPWMAASLPLVALVVWLVRRDRRRPTAPPAGPGPESV